MTREKLKSEKHLMSNVLCWYDKAESGHNLNKKKEICASEKKPRVQSCKKSTTGGLLLTFQMTKFEKMTSQSLQLLEKEILNNTQ